MGKREYDKGACVDTFNAVITQKNSIYRSNVLMN